MAIEPPVWKNGPDTFDQDKKNTMLYDALIRYKTIMRVAKGTDGFDFALTLNGEAKAARLSVEQNLNLLQLTRDQVLSLVIYDNYTWVKEV